jgi:predicted dehydrogenase
MVATAGQTERFLMEAIWTWFLPAVIAIRARIAAGEIGEIRFVESTFALNIPGPIGRHRELGLAGGALLDLGIYPVAFTRFLLGAPSVVRAVGQIGDTGVDVNVGAVLGHSSGAVSVFTTGLDAVSTLTATITGTAGIITVDAPFWCPTSFTVNRHDGAPERVTLEHQGLAHEAAHAMARLRGGHLESDVLPLATSISIMETLDEIRSQIGMVYPQD